MFGSIPSRLADSDTKINGTLPIYLVKNTTAGQEDAWGGIQGHVSGCP